MWPYEETVAIDFARAALFDLIVLQLKRTHPELIPAGANAVDPIRRANIPAKFKRDILDTIWHAAGPETLLLIGQGLRDGRYDPMWQATLSASPAIAFDKWRRFERFGHSLNRVQIEQTGERQAAFTRHTVDGGTPTAPENLLICGLIIVILEEIGCRDLRCEMALDGGAVHCLYERGRFFVPDDPDALMSAAWTIEWQSFTPLAETVAPEIAPPDIPLPTSCDPKARASLEAITRLLIFDVARQWKVGELAHEAGLSTRTLQRKLQDAELSFSQLVRRVRIHEACRLLKKNHMPITTIGFCAGFSDSAHFSRDFNASMGMTPSDFRALWQTE